MRADEFLRAHAPDRHLQTLHDILNGAELERLEAKFTGGSPCPTETEHRRLPGAVCSAEHGTVRL